jgi:myo-inositol-1(or 4)-monophosphatase
VSLVDELMMVGVQLAAEAARVHRDGVGRVNKSRTKSSSTDVVTEIDHRAEAVIVEGIRRARPLDAYLGEEGADAPGTSGVRWIVDPLDGTTNYVYGFPAYAVSIGIEIDGQTMVGVVHDSTRDEVFVAVRGEGARCNGEPISVSGKDVLATSLIATGFGYDPAMRARQAAVLPGLLPRVRDIRRGGSCAIDLCWTACGRLDGYYERGPAEWDVAAGMLIAAEAGARCLRTGAADAPATERLTIVANPAIFDELRGLVD